MADGRKKFPFFYILLNNIRVYLLVLKDTVLCRNPGQGGVCNLAYFLIAIVTSYTYIIDDLSSTKLST